MGGRWLPVKASEQTPRGSAWARGQNTSFPSVSQSAGGRHATREEEEKGPSIQKKEKKKKRKKIQTTDATTRGRKEGEGVHALPRGNVTAMLGSQLTASG